MANEDKRIWTVFNGEIYNHAALRRDLEALGHVFYSRADTEVLVHGYEAWGARELAQRLQGIFAFAIYDQGARRILLCRDRLGVKPLYWWCDGSALLFASETKALLGHPAISARRVNRRAVAQYVVTRYVSRPETFFEGIKRLPEGHFLEMELSQGNTPLPKLYWDWQPRVQPITAIDACNELDRLLTHTIDAQLMSDVPLGVQLSGGVDSSMVVAIMQSLRNKRSGRTPIKTFSVGFDEAGFSELEFARKVARRYGTEHHEITIGASEFFQNVARLCWYYDEPMGEPPAVPTYHMCKKAKQHVTVLLSGEGADEIFAGYSKYVFEQLLPIVEWLPVRQRNKALRAIASKIPVRGRRIRAILERLSEYDPARRYASWYGGFDTTSQGSLMTSSLQAEVGDGGIEEAFGSVLDACVASEELARFQYCDLHTRLVDDILVKGDRMSMAAGIEVRVPYLDHPLAEFAARLPRRLRVDVLRSKVLLKRLAESYLPRDVIYRRKVGFTVPLARWFAGPLAEFLRACLLSERALARNYCRPESVREILDEHTSRRVDREQEIWLLLTLELWHRLFIDEDGSEMAMERVNAEFNEEMQCAQT